MAVKQTAGRDALGEFAPKFAELNMESRGQAIPAGPLAGDGGGPDGAGLDG